MRYNEDEFKKIQQITLDKIRGGFARSVSKQFIIDGLVLNESNWVGVTFEEMILEINFHIMGRKIGSDLVRYPATWWQHFKETYFTDNMLRRWPVCYMVKKMDFYTVWPGLEIPGHKSLSYTEEYSHTERGN